MRISEVVSAKPSQQVVTISPEATVRELIALLAQHNVGALVVSHDGQSVVGIVSERDVVRRLSDDAEVLERQVATIMTSSVHTCELDHDVDELMRSMTERRIRHVPVVTDNQLVGIVSIGDVVKSRMDELEFENDQLGTFMTQNQF